MEYTVPVPLHHEMWSMCL